MNVRAQSRVGLMARGALLLALLLGGTACSYFSDKAKVPELAAISPKLDLRNAWTAHIGAVNFALEPSVHGNKLVLAGSDGNVVEVDADTGREAWRVNVGSNITAGVGSDGQLAAVVTRENQVVGVQAGQVLWRAQLPAQSYTPPLVAGGRVFVLAADLSVTALDGGSGRKLWAQQRTSESLVLRQSGVLLAVGDTLVVGQGGRLAALNPNSGATRWEQTIGTSRGTNDVERLIDLVGPASRVGAVVCVRSFQTAVGCVDVARGQLMWTKKANGAAGLSGDDKAVLGSEADGTLVAWNRSNGEHLWQAETLKGRGLGAPLVAGSSVLVGDSQGVVHVVSRGDGSMLNRANTDGSAILLRPVLAHNTVVVVTRSGGVFGFIPQR